MRGAGRDLWRDRDGVANTIGAIVVVGILLSAYIAVQVQYVPVWEKEAESRHMEEVTLRFGDLRSMLDTPGNGGSQQGGARVIPLSPAKTMFSTGPSSHGLEFRPDDQRVETDLLQFVSVPDDGRDMFDEAWAPFPDAIEDVMKVLNLRFRFDEVGGPGQDVTSATFTVTDEAGTTLGSFEVEQVRQPPERHLYITSRDEDGNVLFSNPESVFIAHTVSPYWIDALEPKYRFRGILENADKPINIEVDGDLPGTYAINYENSTGFVGPSPGPGLGGGTHLALDKDCGTLVYRAENARLMPQRVKLEHGAAILEQSDGDVFRVPPFFMVRENPEWTTLDLGLACLTGTPASTGSSDQASVQFVREDALDAWGFSQALHLNLSTAHPGIWHDHMSERLAAAGLQVGVNYTLDQDPTSGFVRLHLWGGSPSDVDIRINLLHNTFHTTIRS